MQLVVNDLALDSYSTMIDVAVQGLRAPDNSMYGQNRRWSVRGFLQGDTPAALAAAWVELDNALSRNGGDLRFVDDNNTELMALVSAGSVSGVAIEGFRQIGSRPGSWATLLEYAFEAVAEYGTGPNSSPVGGGITIQFQETLSMSGGGPRRVFLESLQGPPQPQIVCQQTVFRATQQGSATVRGGYPVVPGPIFGAGNLIENPTISPVSPVRTGGSYVDYAVSWVYQFASASALNGVPTQWI